MFKSVSPNPFWKPQCYFREEKHNGRCYDLNADDAKGGKHRSWVNCIIYSLGVQCLWGTLIMHVGEIGV